VTEGPVISDGVLYVGAGVCPYALKWPGGTLGLWSVQEPRGLACTSLSSPAASYERAWLRTTSWRRHRAHPSHPEAWPMRASLDASSDPFYAAPIAL